MNLIRGFYYRTGRMDDGFNVAVECTSFLMIAYSLFCCVVAGNLFVNWVSVAQMLMAAVMLVTLPGFWHQTNRINWGMPLFVAAATVAIACFSAAVGLGFDELAFVSAFVAVLAIFLAVASILSHRLSECLGIVGNAFLVTGLLFWVCSLLVTGVGFAEGVSFAVTVLAIIACGLFSYSNGNRLSIGLGASCALVTFAQLVVLFNLTNGYAIAITIMTAGLLSIAVAKIVANSGADARVHYVAKIQAVGNSLVCAAVGGAALFALSSLAASEAGFSHVALLLLQLLATGIASLSTRNVAWRRGFMVAAMVAAASAIILVANLSTLTFFQRAEVFCIAMGALAVVMGYIGWARESSVLKSDIVSFNLIAGSCVLVLPFIVGLVGDRLGESTVDGWRCLHEIGGLAIALALLGSGILCRVRSTTVSGATLLSVFVASSVLLINIPDQLQQTSVMMMIGGGVFFTTAIVLSVYRDALMALPEKVREGKGVFQILKWR